MSSPAKTVPCKTCPEALPDRYADLTLGARCRLVWGKLRRWYLVRFRPAYVQRSLARRRGECARTGACCHLGFGCPLARGLARSAEVECRVYSARPPNCRVFPIDERDLRDRDLVMPDAPCGYYFAAEGETGRYRARSAK